MDKKKSTDEVAQLPTATEFSEDPLEIAPVQQYSQIPTPVNSFDENGGNGDGQATSTTTKSDEMKHMKNEKDQDAKKDEVNKRTDKGRGEETVRKRSGLANIPLVNQLMTAVAANQHKKMSVEEREEGAQVECDERMPLLPSCSSLPTVVDFDNLSVVQSDVTGPLLHTQSEIGRDEIVRNNNKRKKKRRRCATERGAQSDVRPKAVRPLIPSSFMPIPTEIGDALERRSTAGGGQSRERETLTRSYGSMRKTEQRHLGKGPTKQQSLSRSSESSSDEESSSEMDESTDDSVSLTNKSTFLSLNSREWLTIVIMVTMNLCSTIAFSCIAPFYPAEAALKKLTETQVGVVFGIFEFVMFLVAPLFGKYMTYIGSKNMFVVGLLITGITAILFGFLNYLPPGQPFFWASLLVRAIEAVGDSAFITSSFAICAKAFPTKISLVVGLLETFAGLGYTVGPAIGGFLYEYGGFQTPFLVLGVTLLLASLLSFFFIEKQDDQADSDGGGKGILQMLAISRIWLMIYGIFVCAVSLSFLDPTLSPHLATFSLSPTMIGMFFLLCGGIYTLSAPALGFLIDRWPSFSPFLMLFGSAATVVSMLLMGPSPLLPLDKSLFLIGVALAVLGIAAGAMYIPTFQSCLDVVKKHGYEDSFRTYGCVSGVFQSAFSLGAFAGPTIGGLAVEHIGFGWTVTIIAGIHILFITCLILFELVDRYFIHNFNSSASQSSA